MRTPKIESAPATGNNFRKVLIFLLLWGDRPRAVTATFQRRRVAVRKSEHEAHGGKGSEVKPRAYICQIQSANCRSSRSLVSPPVFRPASSALASRRCTSFVARAPPEPRTRSREFASAAPSTGLMPSRRRCTLERIRQPCQGASDRDCSIFREPISIERRRCLYLGRWISRTSSGKRFDRASPSRSDKVRRGAEGDRGEILATS